jgi:hypothetical protein
MESKMITTNWRQFHQAAARIAFETGLTTYRSLSHVRATVLPAALVASLFLLSACSRQSDSNSSPGKGPSTITIIRTDKEAKEERRTKLKADLIKQREALARAYATPGDYVLVAILDRNVQFQRRGQTRPGTYTQLLILHRAPLDLDDYGFSIAGKEKEETDDTALKTFRGELISVDKEGNAQFTDPPLPAGTCLVVEWFVQNKAPVVSFVFGGIPCLKVRIKD